HLTFLLVFLSRRLPRSTLFPYTTLFRSLSGRVSKALEESRPGDAAADLDRLVTIFGQDNTYVEIQNAGLEPQARINPLLAKLAQDRKSTRLNSSHQIISYAVFCLKKKNI